VIPRTDVAKTIIARWQNKRKNFNLKNLTSQGFVKMGYSCSPFCPRPMAFSRKLDKRDFRKQWHTFSPNQLQNTGDDLPPPAKE
jgi:hypothetical protein